jgi:hypothetical protein
MDKLNPPRDKLRPTTDNDWSYHIINIIILVWLCYIYTYSLLYIYILIILYVHIQFFGQCILIIL